MGMQSSLNYPLNMRLPTDSSSDDEQESLCGSDEGTDTLYSIQRAESQCSGIRTPVLLEESLALVNSLQTDIQKMRKTGFVTTNQSVRSKYCRRSSSCPSLDQQSADEISTFQVTGSKPISKVSSDVSTKGCDGGSSRVKPRSSEMGKECSTNNERHYVETKLRNSVSLSSLDSEPDDQKSSALDSEVNRKKHMSMSSSDVSHAEYRSTVGNSGYQNHRNVPVGESRNKIHKSLSTPSILRATKESADADAGKLSHESELDEDAQQPSLAHNVGLHDTFIRDQSFMQDGRKQRRKRSSIFFRKKKDKEKAKKFTNSLTLLQRGSQAVQSARWLSNTSNPANSTISQLQMKVSPPIVDFSRSKSSSDMEDPLLQCESSNFSDSFDPSLTTLNVVDDTDLGLLDDESEAWSGSVDRKVLSDLTEKQIKRQEHIYELVMTEKHHCLTLKVMQKIFSEGMQKELGYGVDVIERLFPRLDDLISLHMSLLKQLRDRQRHALYVEQFGDLLREVFSGHIGNGMRECYSHFCASHSDSVALYKDLLKSDRRFQDFIHRCSFNPLLKKKGIPECILFVTHRVTKYPLLIDPLIKTSRHCPREIADLTKALQLVKGILVDVNSHVAEKQKEARLLEIYARIDTKSTAVFHGKKFRKSDVLSENRRLMFEGTATMPHTRGRHITVQVIVMSDLIFFLNENNQKYHFVSQDGKASVVPLQRLLVRDKAGAVDSRGVYLISNASDPDMYEMECIMPRDKRIWVDSISDAVKQCPYEVVTNKPENLHDFTESLQSRVGRLLRAKDLKLALLCEERLRLHTDLLDAVSQTAGIENPLSSAVGSICRSYAQLSRVGADNTEIRILLDSLVQDIYRLSTQLFPVGGSLSRSVSSVGEHSSNAFVSPSVPKRAETFSGFDSSIAKLRNSFADGIEEEIRDPETVAKSTVSGGEAGTGPSQIVSQSVTCLGRGASERRHHQSNLHAVHLHHSLSALLRILTQTTTNLAIYHAGLMESTGDTRVSMDKMCSDSIEPRLSVKLEELRNLQDQLSKEKTEWAIQRDNHDKWIKDKRLELSKQQEQLAQEQADVAQQRELLYRQLDALRSQGILLSPNLQVVTVAQADGSAGASGAKEPACSRGSASRTSRRPPSAEAPLPAHLVSSVNQLKASATALPVRQELPMKLAKLSSSSALASLASTPPTGGERRGQDGVHQMLPLRLSQQPRVKTSAAGYQRFSTGASPRQSESVRSESAASSPPCPKTTVEHQHEEVIYF